MARAKSPERLPAGVTPDPVILEAVRAAGDPAGRPIPSLLSSTEAQGIVDQLALDLEDAARRRTKLEEALDAAADSVKLKHDGAEEVYKDALAAVVGIEAEIQSIMRRQQRDSQLVTSAVSRESMAAHAKRVDAAKALVEERIPLCAELDALLAKLGVVATALDANARALSDYKTETGTDFHRMQLGDSVLGAIFAKAPALGKMLGVPHPRNKAISANEPLAVVEQRHFARFHYVAIPNATGDVDVKLAPVFDPTDPMLGQHGAIAREKMTTGGTEYAPFDVLSGELVLSWPLKNRVALARIGKIEFLPKPAVSEGE